MIFVSGPFYYIKEHLKKYSFSEKINEESVDKVERAIMALSSFNLFGEDYVLLANIDKWKKSERDKLMPYLNDKSLLTSGSLDMREKFFKYVKKNSSESYIFDYIKPWETDKWLKYIVNTGKKYNLNMDNGVAFEIFKKIGEDYDRIHSELEKLSSVRRGAVTMQDLQYLSDGIVDLTKSIVDKIITKQKPYSEINSFFKLKMSSVSLLYALMKNYQTLLIIKTYVKKPNMRWNEINNWAKKLKISTGIFAKFVGYSFVKNSKNQDYRKIYSINELYKILEKLLDLEASIKIFDSKSHFVSFIEYLHYDLQR